MIAQGKMLNSWGITMKLPRRNFLYSAIGATVVPALSRVASALDYPTRPVHVIVGFAAGINPDVIARLFAQCLSERLGQQFIVDDRPGAASTIGTELVVRAPPDGYTLLAVTSTNTVNATLYDNLSYNFIHDIAPIAGTVRVPSVIALTMSFPAKTVPEFIAYAKANPGKITMASPGAGSAAHAMGELFADMTGIELLHVPYRASYFPDLLSGQVQIVFVPISSVIEFIRAGKLRALAVTGVKRSDALPDVPTVAEFVPGYEAYVWDGIGAPRGTPADIVDKLNKSVNICFADPTMKARLADLGADPMPMTPSEFGKFIADEIEKWGKVIRAANFKPE
jgi:tripartite-type tricarboxylate transporter receptor subunit TctC